MKYGTSHLAFSGEGAAKYAQRWNHAANDLRAVYCSDSLALACLECLVHIRPLPRAFPRSVYFSIDIPDALLERPDPKTLPRGWNIEPAGNASRDFGTKFLRSRRAVGLVVPTIIQPIGWNVVLNPLHPEFDPSWISPPSAYEYDGRLT